MDRKTAFILSLGKYGGYIAVFWVAVSLAGLAFIGPLLPLFLVFAQDNIRTYCLTARLPELIVPSLYLSEGTVKTRSAASIASSEPVTGPGRSLSP